MRRFLILAIALCVPACDNRGDELRMPQGALPAAAELAPGMETESIDRQLRELEAELAAALEGESERLLTAEAITDRLVHARRDVDWLASGYDVEARLRQLQAMADRVVARLQRGSSVERVREDVSTILAAVRDLREQLAREGGGTAPPLLDSLLAQDPLRDVQSPALRAMESSGTDPREPVPGLGDQRTQPASGPLGTPVQRDTTPGP